MIRGLPGLLATYTNTHMHSLRIVHFIHISVTVHMAALILMAMKRVLWTQHKNHYEQMCVIFMGLLNLRFFSQPLRIGDSWKIKGPKICNIFSNE